MVRLNSCVFVWIKLVWEVVINVMLLDYLNLVNSVRYKFLRFDFSDN